MLAWIGFWYYRSDAEIGPSMITDYIDYTMMTNGRYRFSANEHRITAMLADGFGERVIAQHLRIPRGHVKNCISRCLRRNCLESKYHLARVYASFEEVVPDSDSANG